MDTERKNARVIREHIQNQMEKDQAEDQLSRKKNINPFTGSKRKQAKIKQSL